MEVYNKYTVAQLHETEWYFQKFFVRAEKFYCSQFDNSLLHGDELLLAVLESNRF